MMLFWKIRYLDRTDKQFKDRYLCLDTKSLDPVTRAAVELIAESRSNNTDRGILKYKALFLESNPDTLSRDTNSFDKIMSVGPTEFFEDETGKEITDDDIAQILTGSPTARAIPSGAKQHDIDLMLAEKKPIPLAEVELSNEDVRLLGYFGRDLREMEESAFMKDGPGTLTSFGNFDLNSDRDATLETAVTDDEIRSFVTIFRRLYMTGANDPASFVKIVPILATVLRDHPYGRWIQGTFDEYQRHLDSAPDVRPFVPSCTCTFSTKRLIDVFLYTQYAHQPDSGRQRQFEKCLTELNGKHAVLTWMFLTEMWKLSREIMNAGRLICWWFENYCKHHQIKPDVINSLRTHHAGLGTAEKEENRRQRLFQEKVQVLANELWEQAGRPVGGATQYLKTARDHLIRSLG